MKYLTKTLIIVALLFYSCVIDASTFTDWQESPNDPIYAPYNTLLPEDYAPYVLFSETNFDGNGASVPYKMWHQGPTGISLSYSNDGASWQLVGEVVTDVVMGNVQAYHPVVLYDKNGFGGSQYHYKMWYWTGNPGPNPPPPALAIKSAQSVDGVTWTTPIDNTQDATQFLSGTIGTYFYQFYGFGQMFYNPDATSIPGEPLTFPYVVYFDSASAAQLPDKTQEAVGLAYSSDGIHWFRYGSAPVLIPSGNTAEWDGRYAYRATIFQYNDEYHMFYSGSSQLNNPEASYTYGIGHASSSDGINWTRDPDNPIFTINDPGEEWRSGRTLFASAITNVSQMKSSCNHPAIGGQMWFSGGTNIIPPLGAPPIHPLQNVGAFATQAVGYATLPLLAAKCDRMWLKLGESCECS